MVTINLVTTTSKRGKTWWHEARKKSGNRKRREDKFVRKRPGKRQLEVSLSTSLQIVED